MELPLTGLIIYAWNTSHLCISQIILVLQRKLFVLFPFFARLWFTLFVPLQVIHSCLTLLLYKSKIILPHNVSLYTLPSRMPIKPFHFYSKVITFIVLFSWLPSLRLKLNARLGATIKGKINVNEQENVIKSWANIE